MRIALILIAFAFGVMMAVGVHGIQRNPDMILPKLIFGLSILFCFLLCLFNKGGKT